MLLIILAFILSIATFLFIERPVRFGHHKLIELKLALLLLSTTAVGTVVFAGDGLPDRRSVAESAPFRDETQWVRNTYVRDPMINGSYAPADALSVPWGDHGRSGWYQYMFNDAGGDVTYAIWGNSYGRHAFHGFSNVFGRDAINVLYVGGWTPKNRLMLPVPEIEQMSSAYAKEIIDFLCGQPSIRKIFIINRFIDAETTDNPETYVQRIQDVIDRFVSCGKQVYLVQQNPTLPSNIRNHIKRPFKNLEKLVLNRESYDAECEKLNNLYFRLKDIDIIDTAQLWCPGEHCIAYDDKDLPLYTDRVHLNRTASMMQAEHVKNHLQDNRHEHQAPCLPAHAPAETILRDRDIPGK